MIRTPQCAAYHNDKKAPTVLFCIEDMKNDWFTVENIDSATFVLSEYRHREEPHCYLLCGSERALLIDTGLGVADIAAVVRTLTDLPVTAALTHAHWDHIGGLSGFHEIAVHKDEAAWLSDRFPLSIAEVKAQLLKEPCVCPPDFDPQAYRLFCGKPTRLLCDGDVFELGGRTVEVLHTPGHSPGHCCFYEPARKTLYTGDLLYRGTLYADFPSTDPAAFYASVKKLQALDVKRLLPGHHALDIPVSLRDAVADGLAAVEQCGKLRHGGGRFSFEMFQIQL